MSKRERGYQMDKTAYLKVGGTLNVYMCAQGGMWERIRKLVKRLPQINIMEYFLCTGPTKYLRVSSPSGKTSLFSCIIIPYVRLFYPM